MDEDPGLPPGLCCGCASALTAAVTFRQLCLESLYHWVQATKSLEHIEEPTDLDQTYYVIYNSDDTIVIKDQITKVAGPQKAIERLTASVTAEIKVAKERKRTFKTFTEQNCICPDCEKNFVSYKELDDHLKGSMKRACLKCGVVTDTKLYPDHMYKIHGIELFYCESCYQTFDCVEKLQSHLANTSSNICQVCSKGFDSARALRAHMYAHTLFQCSTCNKFFENRKCYNHHSTQCSQQSRPLALSSTPSTFICDHCGVRYDKKPSLRIHIIQKHLNVLPFVCIACGKRTSTLAHLKSHELVHEIGRKIYSCALCNAKFRTELGFQLHQRIHSGNKPYMCDHCGDCFISASRRLDHIKRRHKSSQDMPHACKDCPARFVRPFELKKHYRAIHFTTVEVAKQAEKKRRNQPLKVVD